MRKCLCAAKRSLQLPSLTLWRGGPALLCMCDREYIFKHRQTFMRAFTAHAQDLLPDFLTRTPSLRDYLETGGDRVTDDGGMDGGKQEMLNSFSCSLLERLIVRREAIDIMGSPEQIKESMAGTRCSTCNYAVITYFCRASAAAAQLLRRDYANGAGSFHRPFSPVQILNLYW